MRPRLALPVQCAAIHDCGLVALAVRPLDVAELAVAGVIYAAPAAPGIFGHWRDGAQAIRAALGRVPADRVILVGETGAERECVRRGGWRVGFRQSGVSGVWPRRRPSGDRSEKTGKFLPEECVTNDPGRGPCRCTDLVRRLCTGLWRRCALGRP